MRFGFPQSCEILWRMYICTLLQTLAEWWGMVWLIIFLLMWLLSCDSIVIVSTSKYLGWCSFMLTIFTMRIIWHSSIGFIHNMTYRCCVHWSYDWYKYSESTINCHHLLVLIHLENSCTETSVISQIIICTQD